MNALSALNAVIAFPGMSGRRRSCLFWKTFGKHETGRSDPDPIQRFGAGNGDAPILTGRAGMGVPGVDVASPEMAQALLFQSWCSDMAGPVFTSIREEAGLAYYASRARSIFLIAFVCCSNASRGRPNRISSASILTQSSIGLHGQQTGRQGGSPGAFQLIFRHTLFINHLQGFLQPPPGFLQLWIWHG